MKYERKDTQYALLPNYDELEQATNLPDTQQSSDNSSRFHKWTHKTTYISILILFLLVEGLLKWSLASQDLTIHKWIVWLITAIAYVFLIFAFRLFGILSTLWALPLVICWTLLVLFWMELLENLGMGTFAIGLIGLSAYTLATLLAAVWWNRKVSTSEDAQRYKDSNGGEQIPLNPIITAATQTASAAT